MHVSIVFYFKFCLERPLNMKERPNPNLELSSLASPISANTLYFYSTVSKFTGTHSRLLHGGEIPLHTPLSRAFRRPPVRPLAAGKGVAMTSLSSRAARTNGSLGEPVE